MSFLKVINELAATSSKKEKKAILQNNDCDELRRIFKAAYDPTIRYHIKHVPEAQSAGLWDQTTLTIHEAINDLWDRFATRIVTGNAAVDELVQLIGNLSDDDAELLRRIVQRDLRCGVSAKTINDAYGEIVPDFEKHVMLAQPLNEKSQQRLQFPAYVQTKMDGVRINCFVNRKTNAVDCYTRKGQIIHVPQDSALADQLRAVCRDMQLRSNDEDTIVLDGEIVAYESGEMLTGEPMSRRKSNGIVNKAIKQTATPFELDSLRVWVWDTITLSEWKARKSDRPYYERLEAIFSHINTYQAESDHRAYVHGVPTEMITTVHAAQQHAQVALDRGEEGVVVKPAYGIWEGKRSYEMIKMKGVYNADFRVIGVVPHSKDPNLMGSLECQTEDGLIQFSVGTGFTQEDRETIGEEIIGKIVECNFNDIISSDSSDAYSLFLPVFIEVREDKDTADTVQKVFEEMGNYP